VSSPGCCASPGGPGQPVNRLAPSPACGRTTGSDRRVRLVAIKGSMSRARSGVPWERGGPRLAPRRGLPALMRRLGLLTPWFDPGIGRYLSFTETLVRRLCLYGSRGAKTHEGEALAPLVAFSDLPCRGRGPGRPPRRRRLTRPAASTLDCRHRRAGRRRDGWGEQRGWPSREVAPPAPSCRAVGAARRGYWSCPRGVAAARFIDDDSDAIRLRNPTRSRQLAGSRVCVGDHLRPVTGGTYDGRCRRLGSPQSSPEVPAETQEGPAGTGRGLGTQRKDRCSGSGR
jgi:hypothetical protein